MPYRQSAADDVAYDLVFAVTARGEEPWRPALLSALADHELRFDEADGWFLPPFAFAAFFELEEGRSRFGTWSSASCPFVGPVVGFVAVSLAGVSNPEGDILEPLARCALGPVLRIADGAVLQPVRERTVLLASMVNRFGAVDDALLFAEEESAYLRAMQDRVAAVLSHAGLDGFCGADWDNKLKVGLFGKDGMVMSPDAAVRALGSLDVNLWLFDRSVLG